MEKNILDYNKKGLINVSTESASSWIAFLLGFSTGMFLPDVLSAISGWIFQTAELYITEKSATMADMARDSVSGLVLLGAAAVLIGKGIKVVGTIITGIILGFMLRVALINYTGLTADMITLSNLFGIETTGTIPINGTNTTLNQSI